MKVVVKASGSYGPVVTLGVVVGVGITVTNVNDVTGCGSIEGASRITAMSEIVGKLDGMLIDVGGTYGHPLHMDPTVKNENKLCST